MQGRDELTLDHAIARASATGTLVRHEVVAVFLEVLLVAVDSAVVPEPSRIVLAEDGSISFTQPPAAAAIHPSVPVHAACALAASLFRAANLDLPVSLQGPLETAAERFPTLRHLRDAFELELLISGSPPPTEVERRMAIAALMAKARQLRGRSAGPVQRRRELARVAPEPEPRPISPHAAITSPAFRVRLPPWMHTPLPRWAPIAAAAVAGALVAMLLQQIPGKQQPPPPQPAPPVSTSTIPPLLEAPHAPADAHGTQSLPVDVRVAVRERAATPTAPAVREKGNASQAAPPSEASPRPVRPLRRRVAAATEASAAARARLQQGDESLREGRLFEAVVAFREALDSDPTFATAARRLGDAYRQHNDTALAISAYERYLEMDPSAADAEEVRSALEELRAPTAKEE